MNIDDRIRQALEQALPVEPVADPAALTERITEAAQRQSAGAPDASSGGAGAGAAGGSAAASGALLPALVVAAGLAVGAVLGFLMPGEEAAGTAATLRGDSVPVFVCPGDGQAGTLHSGDRVYIVGRTGGWLAVRNVRGGGEIVFVAAEHVTPDADLSNLPERDCEPEGVFTLGDPFGLADPDETTTTTEPGETTTTVPGVTTTTAPATTTTQPADTTPPEVGNAFISEQIVYETWGACEPPHTATIHAFVTDNVGVTEVRATWTIDGQNFAVLMTGGPDFTGTFGPFAFQTVTWQPPFQDLVTVTITARDAAGNTSSEQVTVIVDANCVF